MYVYRERKVGGKTGEGKELEEVERCKNHKTSRKRVLLTLLWSKNTDSRNKQLKIWIMQLSSLLSSFF